MPFAHAQLMLHCTAMRKIGVPLCARGFSGTCRPTSSASGITPGRDKVHSTMPIGANPRALNIRLRGAKRSGSGSPTHASVLPTPVFRLPTLGTTPVVATDASTTYPTPVLAGEMSRPAHLEQNSTSVSGADPSSSSPCQSIWRFLCFFRHT